MVNCCAAPTRSPVYAAVLGLLWCQPGSVRAQDTLEFLSGAKVQGKLIELREAEAQLVFEVTLGTRQLKRTYPINKILAVTVDGQRRVLNAAPPSANMQPGQNSRSRAEVERVIEQLGSTPPAWFDSTPLEYPVTLDLAWPLKPPENGWDNQRNVGQYIWDIINPNPGRWRSGVRLVYHLMSLHAEDKPLLDRDMYSLAGMYFRLFQDYPRAAYWWRKVGVVKGDADSISLAECYWRMGSRPMATSLLDTTRLRSSMVKLWGDMGDTERALHVANRLAPLLVKRKISAGEVYLHAGDALCATGNLKPAMAYYQRVLDEPEGLKGRVELNRNRALANIAAIELYELLDLKQIPDGTYTDQSIGFSGPVHVEVTVRTGRIEAVTVTRHEERQFYAAMTDTPQQIIQKQSVQGIDATSHATVTAEAIVNATAKALAKASPKR